MPTYLYECSKCNDQFEVDQRITEPPLNVCHCGATGTVRRLIQPTAILFKGSGFYVNDSKKSAEPTPVKAAAPDSAIASPATSDSPSPTPSATVSEATPSAPSNTPPTPPAAAEP